MDQKKVDEAMEKMLLQPKVVEVDGQRVENHTISEVISADRYLASKNATRRRRCPVRFAKMAAGGAVE